MSAHVGAVGAAGELTEALRAEIERKMGGKKAYFNNWDALGDAGAVFVAEKLCGNTDVELLVLSNCGIGAAGARALGKSLGEDNVTLKILILSKNRVDDDGAESMAQMLRKNTTLEALYLNACDVGASSLLAALRESNSSLTELYLYDNGSIEEIKDSISDMLRENAAVQPASAERRARCLLFCCLHLAPTAHEHVVPSIGAVPVPVMQYAVEYAGELHVAKRFEVGDLAVRESSAGVRDRSSSSDGSDFQPAAARRR